MKALALALCLGSIALCHATEPTRIPVTSVKPLLLDALEKGEAHGTLTGRAAEAVRRRFKTESPIDIDVIRTQPVDSAGCSRFEILTRQSQVEESDKPADLALRYQVSYCRDGRFPVRK